MPDPHELAERFEAGDPSLGDDLGSAALRNMAFYVRDIAYDQRELAKAVCAAHAEGHSWAVIGAMLGVTGATARRRYGGTTRFDDES